MQKIVLVTGCGSGLGKSIVESLARKGHIVYAGIRKQEDIKKMQSLWKVAYPAIRPIKLDITDDTECKKSITTILAKEGRIDTLINSAGNTLVGPVEQFTSLEFADLLNINVIGAFRMIREVVPFMKEKKSGHIINVTSLNGIVALPHFSIYCASKFALEGLTRSLVHELSRDNIWITNIEPGAIKKTSPSAEKAKKMPHTPAREKYWIIRFLLPLVEDVTVVEKIALVVENPTPPTSMLLGRDAKITTLMQRFLPEILWNKIIGIISK